MRQPTVPYHEAGVRAEVEAICREAGLAATRDRFGNVLVRLQRNPHLRPLALCAHMDHPGFEISRSLGGGRWMVRFLGGVPDEFFRQGTKLRLWPGGENVRLGIRLGKHKEFEVRTTSVQTVPRFATWDVGDFSVRQGRIHERACDDLIGVATVLATLVALKKSDAQVNVVGVISRAEEVGFQGALAIAAGKSLPKKSLVISLETSREMPPVKMGAGVIIRVGDRQSVFDSEATRFLTEVAGELRVDPQGKGFAFQRALMSGGACEGTAYQEFGYQTAAVCVALGNYHNCTPNGKIAAEFISVADACNMVRLLVSVAHRMPDYRALVGRLPLRLQVLQREAKMRLRQRP
jgi:endoglucanase